MKKLISLILSMILCASLAVPALAAGVTFSDVPQTYWGYTQIERAFADGVIAGTYHNEQTGERQFSPESTLTLAHFVVITTRAFYGAEVDVSTATGTWYARNQAVANQHGLLEGLGNVSLDSAANRYQMAVIMANIMEDKGADMPTAAELKAAQAKIGDWASIPAQYQNAVATVFHLGIISGTDSKGTFNGNGSMKRSHAAVVYGRLADAIDELTEAEETPGKETESTPVPAPDPEPAPAPAGTVGTISDTKVALSFDTHAPVYDWWSTLPADVRAVTDKDAMNGIWQSAHDWNIIMNQGAFGTKFNTKRINEYYNYAVYSSSNANYGTVNSALAIITTHNASVAELHIPGTASGLNAGLVFANSSKDKLDPIFEPILAKMNDSMTDREKVQICVKAITDRFEYGLIPGTVPCTWTNGNTYGVCDHFKILTAQLLAAAGIPVITCVGDTELGPHGWNIALIDGEWLVVDSTAAEGGYSMPMTYAQHAKLYGYSTDYYTTSVAPIVAAAREIAEMFAEMGIYG